MTSGWGLPDDGPCSLDSRSGQLAVARDNLLRAWGQSADPDDRADRVRQVLASLWDLAYNTGANDAEEDRADPFEVASLSVRCPVGDCPGRTVGQPCADMLGRMTVHAVRTAQWQASGGQLPH